MTSACGELREKPFEERISNAAMPLVHGDDDRDLHPMFRDEKRMRDA